MADDPTFQEDRSDARAWATKFKDNDLSWVEHSDALDEGAELILALLQQIEALEAALSEIADAENYEGGALSDLAYRVLLEGGFRES